MVYATWLWLCAAGLLAAMASAQSCQTEATSATARIGSSFAGWCTLNDELTRISNWFDSGTSWAEAHILGGARKAVISRVADICIVHARLRPLGRRHDWRTKCVTKFRSRCIRSHFCITQRIHRHSALRAAGASQVHSAAGFAHCNSNTLVEWSCGSGGSLVCFSDYE